MAGNALPVSQDYGDLEELQFFTFQGRDRHGRRILRIVGKFLPAPIIDNSRLKDYVIHKLSNELKEEPFCIAYFHTRVNRKENCPGIFWLRWIYEALPLEYRSKLAAVYFVHPGLLSRTLLGTVGRFFLSDRLYYKLNYISRIEFLWSHIKQGEIQVPEFVFEHDELLEHQPLMDYWLESDPISAYNTAGLGSRESLRWAP